MPNLVMVRYLAVSLELWTYPFLKQEQAETAYVRQREYGLELWIRGPYLDTDSRSVLRIWITSKI